MYPLPTADPARQQRNRLPDVCHLATLVRDVSNGSAGSSVMARYKPIDPKGRHIRVYVSLVHSPAYRCLGWAARALFFEMRSAVNGSNNGNISAALADLRHVGWKSSQTLARALYELRALGFIAVTREGGLRQGSRMPALYRFTDLEVFDQPKISVQACKPTEDYARFTTLAEARAALRDGVARLQEKGRRKQFPKKLPVPKRNRIASETEPMKRSSASETEQGKRASLPKRNRDRLA